MPEGLDVAEFLARQELRVVEGLDPQPPREEIGAAASALALKQTGAYTVQHERIIMGVLYPMPRKSMVE